MQLTVIIPTRNRSALLATAIESVLASPLITSPSQVIVVDDESSDDTPAVVQRYGVRSLRMRGGRVSVTRNAGLALADTEFVAFLDDDDLWLPNNMAPQLAALAANPGAAYAFGRVQSTTPDLVPVGQPNPLPPLPNGDGLNFVFQVHIQIATVLFRRELLAAEGGFDPLIRYVEDSDLLVRLAAKYRVIGVDFVGSLYRFREPSVRDGELRWQSHCDYIDGLKKLRRLGVRLPRMLRLKADLHFRGMTAGFFCADARLASRLGYRRKAMEYLMYAFRVSPAHVLLRLPQFWTTLGALLVHTAAGVAR